MCLPDDPRLSFRLYSAWFERGKRHLTSEAAVGGEEASQTPDSGFLLSGPTEAPVLRQCSRGEFCIGVYGFVFMLPKPVFRTNKRL